MQRQRENVLSGINFGSHMQGRLQKPKTLDYSVIGPAQSNKGQDQNGDSRNKEKKLIRFDNQLDLEVKGNMYIQKLESGDF